MYNTSYLLVIKFFKLSWYTSRYSTYIENWILLLEKYSLILREFW